MILIIQLGIYKHDDIHIFIIEQLGTNTRIDAESSLLASNPHVVGSVEQVGLGRVVPKWQRRKRKQRARAHAAARQARQQRSNSQRTYSKYT